MFPKDDENAALSFSFSLSQTCIYFKQLMRITHRKLNVYEIENIIFNSQHTIAKFTADANNA